MNTVPILPFNETIAFAPQLNAALMKEVAELGFRSVINNRPDFEAGPDQPTNQSVEAAAKALGLAYAFVPIPSASHTQEDAQKMKAALEALPKPILAFCRSGTRSKRLYLAARALDNQA